MNYAGLAELGWRATQTINGKNGYDDWEKMDDTEKQILDRLWRETVPTREKDRLLAIVAAACDAYIRAVTV